MDENIYIPLNRAVISVAGNDAVGFLQGIISNDINKVSVDNAIYAYFLTPQGKYISDFFISKRGEEFLIEIEKDYAENFLKKLNMYKLRSNVEINDLSDEFEVCALIGENVFSEIKSSTPFELGKTIKFCKGVAYIDPRSQKMFGRSVIERENEYQSFHAKGFEKGDILKYHELRILNNVPEGIYDLEQEKSFPLQYRMIELNGVDFDKGCYVGQEVTARTHHRGVVRKSTYIVKSENGKQLELGDEVLFENQGVGKVLSSSSDVAIAYLDKEYEDKSLTTANNTSISIVK